MTQLQLLESTQTPPGARNIFRADCHDSSKEGEGRVVEKGSISRCTCAQQVDNTLYLCTAGRQHRRAARADCDDRSNEGERWGGGEWGGGGGGEYGSLYLYTPGRNHSRTRADCDD